MTSIITGLSPGPGGVPQFLEYLRDVEKFNIIYPKKWLNDEYSFKSKIKSYINYIYSILMTDENPLIMHHQSVPFVLLIYLHVIKNARFFIIDNSYFCVKSYNHVDDHYIACRKCLKSYSFNRCNVFPKRVRHKILEVSYLKFLQMYQSRIDFYTLSDNSTKLANLHFERAKSIQTIGFTTTELNLLSRTDINARLTKHKKLNSEMKLIVYHGTKLHAKGYSYALKLCERMQDVLFYFPFEIKDKKFKNITSEDANWNTGLADMVMKADLVLTPSIWDSTPEAAVLKSLMLYKNICIFDTKFGYLSDRMHSNNFTDFGLRLCGNLDVDVEKIRIYLQNFDSFNIKSNQIAKDYISNSMKLINLKLSK